MKIIIQNELQINNRTVCCNIDLKKNCLNLISGENGVGKSSMIHFLKSNSQKFFNERVVRYIDQERLNPLNKINFSKFKDDFHALRKEKSKLYLNSENLFTHLFDTPINELSGGQNQMIKILTSLYLGGDIFVFDEPFQYLDKKNIIVLKEILMELLKADKVIIIVEHNIELIKEFSLNNLHMSIENDKIEVINGV